MEKITLHVSYHLANRKLIIMKFKSKVSLPWSLVGTCMSILVIFRGPHSCMLFTTI